jgi:hypothetical protein
MSCCKPIATEKKCLQTFHPLFEPVKQVLNSMLTMSHIEKTKNQKQKISNRFSVNDPLLALSVFNQRELPCFVIKLKRRRLMMEYH